MIQQLLNIYALSGCAFLSVMALFAKAYNYKVTKSCDIRIYLIIFFNSF